MKRNDAYYQMLREHANDAITLRQIEVMQHAIGFDRSRVKRGIYRMYRNYFAVFEKDERWEGLLRMGLATAQKGLGFREGFYYAVSKAGVALLQDITDVDIRSDEYA